MNSTLEQLISVTYECKICKQRSGSKEEIEQHLAVFHQHELYKTAHNSLQTENDELEIGEKGSSTRRRKPVGGDISPKVTRIKIFEVDSAKCDGDDSSKCDEGDSSEYAKGYPSAANIEVPTSAIEVPTPAIEVPTSAIEVPTSAIEVPTSAIEVPTSNIEVPTFNIEVPTSAIEVPTSNIEVPTSNIEVPTSNIEVPTSNIEVPTKDGLDDAGTSKAPRETSFKCQSCTSSFKTREEALNHADSHYESGFKCILCNYQNLRWNQVKVHMQIHNKPGTHSCTDCDHSFASSFALYNHRRYNHLGGEHLCDVCGHYSPSKYLLLQHQLSSHSNHCCFICSFKTDNQRDLSDHMKRRHESGFICKYCVSNEGIPRFKNKIELNAHTSVSHPGSKHFFCSYCNYVAKMRHHVQKHTLMHTGGKPYACRHPNCSFSTKDHKNRRQHEITKHRKPGELVCRPCLFVTTNQNEWDVHHALHHMQGNIKCEECDFESKSRATLRRHRLTKHVSVEDMRYLCPHNGCSYITNVKERLQKHALTHRDKDTLFNCPVCKENFQLRRDFTAHAQEHHPAAKIRACEHCSFTTTKQSALKRHLLRHKPTKDFSCPHCRYRGRTRPLLRSHMIYRHANQPPKDPDSKGDPLTHNLTPTHSGNSPQLNQHVVSQTNSGNSPVLITPFQRTVELKSPLFKGSPSISMTTSAHPSMTCDVTNKTSCQVTMLDTPTTVVINQGASPLKCGNSPDPISQENNL